MKRKNYFARCTSLGAVLLMCGIASVSSAASLSPVGSWDCISDGGGQSGIAFIEFTANGADVPGTYLLQGYELLASSYKSASSETSRGGDSGRGDTSSTTNTPTSGTNVTVHGFFPFSGVWGHDIKNNLIGYLYIVVYDVSTGEPSTNAVSFIGKVSGTAPKQRLSLVSSTSFGKVTYKGLPLISVTNATGNFEGIWTGIKQQNYQSYNEFFTLTDSVTTPNSSGLPMPNIYHMEGNGPAYAYTNGYCMISCQNRIGFRVREMTSGSNSVLRSSIGTFNKTSVTAKTKGSIEPFGTGDNIKFNAMRYSALP